MKVREAIAYLEQFDQELELLVAADAEGNAINHVSEIDLSQYDDSGMGYREITLVHPDDLDPEDQEFIQDAVVIWPV